MTARSRSLLSAVLDDVRMWERCDTCGRRRVPEHPIVARLRDTDVLDTEALATVERAFKAVST